jgi:alpha-beta hydrolase superfamily lysophospholipase
MTTISTPLPLGGTGSLPAPVAPIVRRRAHRAWRIAFHSSLVILCFMLSVIVGLHSFVAYKLSHPPVAPLASNPKLAIQLDYSEVTFPSIDGKTLVDGWWIPAADSRKTVVLSHGYGTNREESWVPMYSLASMLHDRNYNVLMFDYGFASKTHFTPATGGLAESGQLLGALQYARSRHSDELIVWGFSMGAGTALQAALKSEPVDAMILDSTFLPDEDTLYYNLRKQINVPKDPSVSLIRWFFPLMSGSSLGDIPSKQVQNTAYDFPIFLIHGTADDKAPTYLAENIARAQTNQLSQLWVVPGAIHEMIYRTHQGEYIARTTAFLDQVDAASLTKASLAAKPSI